MFCHLVTSIKSDAIFYKYETSSGEKNASAKSKSRIFLVSCAIKRVPEKEQDILQQKNRRNDSSCQIYAHYHEKGQRTGGLA